MSQESPPNSPRSRIGILRPLGIRDFKLLWLGMSVSMLGDGVFWVALAWQVYRLSDAPTALSIVGIAWTLPMVFFLLGAGLVTDRIERRRVMIFADVVRGCAVGAMGVLSVTGSIELWHLIVLSGVFGVGDAFFGPAFGAIVPDIVPPNLIVEANSLDQFVRPLSLIMLGPAVGGLTIDAFGVGQAFLLDAATFAFSGIMLLRISARPPEKKDSITFAGARAELKEGYDYARSQPWLWATLIAAGLTLLAVIGPLEVVLPHLVKYQLGGDAGDLGLIYALGGVGAIIGALVLAQRGLPQRHITVMYILWAIEGIGIILYAFAGSISQAMVIRLLTGGMSATAMVIWGTLMHKLVPKELLGRVSSFDWLMSISLVPLSFALTGPVAASIGDDATMFWAGLLGTIATIAFLFVPGIRDTEGALSRDSINAESDGAL